MLETSGAPYADHQRTVQGLNIHGDLSRGEIGHCPDETEPPLEMRLQVVGKRDSIRQKTAHAGKRIGPIRPASFQRSGKRAATSRPGKAVSSDSGMKWDCPSGPTTWIRKRPEDIS